VKLKLWRSESVEMYQKPRMILNTSFPKFRIILIRGASRSFRRQINRPCGVSSTNGWP
jgi:hypothetical protein